MAAIAHALPFAQRGALNLTEKKDSALDLLKKIEKKQIFPIDGEYEEILSNIELMKSILIEKGEFVKFLGKDLKLNSSFLVEVIKINPSILEYLSDEQKDLEDLFFHLAPIDPRSITYASQRLLGDRGFLYQFIRLSEYHYAIPFMRLDPVLLKEIDFAIEVISNNDDHIDFFLEQFKGDRNFALMVVKKDGLFLQELPPLFLDDLEIVKEAITSEPSAIKFISQRLKKDKEIALTLLRCEGVRSRHIDHLDKELFKDVEFIKEAILVSNMAYARASDEIKQLDEIKILDIVTHGKNSYLIFGSQRELKKDVLLEAAVLNPKILEDLNGRGEINKELIREVFMRNPQTFFAQETVHGFYSDLKREIFDEILSHFFTPKDILEDLHEEVLSCRNECVKDYLVFSINKVDKKNLLSVFLRQVGTSAQKNKLKLLILAGLALPISRENKDHLLKLLLNHYKVFKDHLKQQPLLQLLSNLTSLQLPSEELFNILSTVLSSPRDALTAFIDVLNTLINFDRKLITKIDSKNFSIASLEDLVVAQISQQGIFSSDKKVVECFLKILFKMRRPHAFLSYCSMHKGDLEMKEAILRVTTDLVEGLFYENRYDHSPHMKMLSKELVQIWRTPMQARVAISNAEAFNAQRFLHEKLVLDRHGGDEFKDLVTSLQDRKTSLIESNRLLNSVFNLQAVKEENLLEELKKIYQLMKDESLEHLEFFNDIAVVITQLQKSSTSLDFEVFDTDDFSDLFLCGTEISGSCQRIDGDKKFNKCLLGFVLDGKIRLLAVKNKQGQMIARAVLKLLFIKDRPALFVERVYGNHNYSKALIKFAFEKAKSLKIPIFIAPGYVGFARPLVETLNSIGNRAPYEYEDAGHGVTKGVYSIQAQEILAP